MATKAAPWLRTLSHRPVTGVKRPLLTCRPYSAQNQPEKLPQASGREGPNTQPQEHVSEEAAKMAKMQGQEGPDLDQGTPVQEILKEEKETREQAPEVLKQEAKQGSSGAKPSTDPSGTRSFSTMARRRMEVESHTSTPIDPAIFNSIQPAATTTAATQTTPDLKFAAPPTPIQRMQTRHDPIITQLTNLMMRDGKKAKAESDMQTILSLLRTSPSPTYNPKHTLLPGAPPASHLPLNPVLYLTLAIDSVAPLLRIRSQRGAAGGGQALQIPVPLGLRQRRRQAFTWILDAAAKKGDRMRFPERVAQEIVSVVEGRSGVWERRQATHKLGTAARTSLGWGGRGGFRR